MLQWNKYNTIIIVGLSATGKSWLSGTVPFNFKVFHTDDYMQADWEDQLHIIMDAMRRSSSSKKIVEGVQGYRLLRKLAQQNMQGPDLVVRCIATPEVRALRHEQRGTKVNKQFDNTLSKIWFDYLVELRHNRKKPECLLVDTIKLEVIGKDDLEP